MTGNNPPKQAMLYDYQKNDIEKLSLQLSQSNQPIKVLYQLPTGGGKTVIFSELSRRFIESKNGKVLILTHRKELCGKPLPY